MTACTSTLLECVVATSAVLGSSAHAQRGPTTPQGPPVEVTVGGRTWTQQNEYMPVVSVVNQPPNSAMRRSICCAKPALHSGKSMSN